MASRISREWRIRSQPLAEVEALARRLNIAPVAAQVLMNRGILDLEQARTFLHPTLGGLREPEALPDMEHAAERLYRAVRSGETIAIYGDYDVDGLAATAILMRGLRMLGGDPRYHIPHRLEEGYGLNADTVGDLKEGGAGIIVTVDCGIRAVKEVALARRLGMEVIVTDHHEPGEEVPADALLVNPKLPGSSYPFRELSGAGVAFKLAWALGKQASSQERVEPEFAEFLKNALSLAALGTVADVVPLLDENRIIARFGLDVLSASSSPGIEALCEAARINTGTLSATDIAFRIAPRLNAAGRMGCARKCVELLMTEDAGRAQRIAAELNTENGRRQRMQERILNEARELLDAADGETFAHALVLARENWHAGVVGIVAARLAEEHWRPALLLTIEGDEAHGSARSIPGFNLFEALSECERHLTTFGGHAMAAGLRLPASALDAFREDFSRVAAARLSDAERTPRLDLDAQVTLTDLRRPTVDHLASLAPFGSDNPEPLLAASEVAVPGPVKRIGSTGRHLSFYVRQNGAALRAVAFGMGEQAEAIETAGVCSLAFVPKINRWRGRESVELEVRDVKLGRGSPLEGAS